MIDSIITEEKIIGSVLINNIYWDDISDLITADDFSSFFHREVFRAILAVMNKSQIADAQSVAYHCQTIFNRDIFYELIEIIKIVNAPANCRLYAEMLKNESLCRNIVQACEEIKEKALAKELDVLARAQDIFGKIKENGSNNVSEASSILPAILGSLEDRRLNGGAIRGLPSGFKDLDKITYGLHGGDLIILAGRPSMGKTLFAMNIVEHVVFKEKKTVLVISAEMSKEQLLERSLSSLGRIEADKIRAGNLTDQECLRIVQELVPLFSDTKLFIEDTASMRVLDIRAKARRIKKEFGLSLLVVDYISLLLGIGENETVRIGNISRDLKLLARELNVPLIAISQLNRAVEKQNDKRPSMADLRSSGAIEQDADIILMIYRDEVYNPTTTLNPKTAEIIIPKHRNGKTGKIYLTFNSDFYRFDDFTGIYQEGNIKNTEKKIKSPKEYFNFHD